MGHGKFKSRDVWREESHAGEVEGGGMDESYSVMGYTEPNPHSRGKNLPTGSTE